MQKRVKLGAAVALAAWIAVSLAGQAPAAPIRLSVAEALDLYARGESQRAVDGQPFDGLNVVSVIESLEAWIGPIDRRSATQAELVAHTRREQVAVRMAVDLAASRELTRVIFTLPVDDGQSGTFRHAYAEMPGVPPFDDQRFSAPIVAWACARLPKTGPVEPWEPWWWLASIAILQEAGEWAVLQGRQVVRSGGGMAVPAWRRAVHEEVDKGHLAEARRRLGPLPRIRLADAVSRSAALTDGALRMPIGGGSMGLRLWGRHDVLRLLEEHARTLNSGRFTEVEREFEALLAEPGFEAEVSLRIAQLRLLRRDWPVALQWLGRASGVTEDRTVLATADYFRGWIFERTDRPVDALAAYRMAYARYDRSPNLNVLLATQLMLAGERTEAARVLETNMQEKFDHAWRDLWLLLVEGDARHARRYAGLMREAR